MRSAMLYAVIDKNNHNETFPLGVKNNEHLFCKARKLFESDELFLFLALDGTQIDENENLNSLETTTGITVSAEKQTRKLSSYFHVKRYLRPKNISYPVNIDYFLRQSLKMLRWTNNFMINSSKKNFILEIDKEKMSKS